MNQQIKYSIEKYDIDNCLKAFDGSRFNMILAASKRAREISNSRLFANRKTPGDTNTYEDKPIVQALCEIDQGKIGKEYLYK